MDGVSLQHCRGDVRAASGCVIYDNNDDGSPSVCIVGGGKDDMLTNHVDFYNIRTRTWKQSNSMSEPKGWTSVVAMNNNKEIYVIGGRDLNYNSLKSVEKMSAHFRQQHEEEGLSLTPMTTARSGAAAIKISEKAFMVFGGHDGSSTLSSAEKFDCDRKRMDSSQWKIAAAAIANGKCEGR